MTISPVRMVSFAPKQQNNTSKNFNFNFKTIPLQKDTISFQGIKKAKDYDEEFIKKFEENFDNEDKFNEMLDSLSDEDFVSTIMALGDYRFKLPLIRMNAKNIEKFHDLSQEKFKHHILAEDGYNNTVFHLANAERLGQIFQYLDQDEISTGCLKQNTLGSNTFHLCMLDDEKLKLLCENLDKRAILEGTLGEDGWRVSPFFHYIPSQLSILLDGLEPEDVDILARTTKHEYDNILLSFKADKLQILLPKMTYGAIKELAQKQDNWGRTPFHLMDENSIKILCQYLPQEDIDEICLIENSYGAAPTQTRKNIDFSTIKMQ